jgi:hypothetical protein
MLLLKLENPLFQEVILLQKLRIFVRKFLIIQKELIILSLDVLDLVFLDLLVFLDGVYDILKLNVLAL